MSQSKIDLLGEVGNIKVGKDDQVDMVNLTKHLEWPNGVCKTVCNHCKTIQEVSLHYAKNLIIIMQMQQAPIPGTFEQPTDFHDWYFTMPYCEHCGQNDNFKVTLQKLPKLN